MIKKLRLSIILAAALAPCFSQAALFGAPNYNDNITAIFGSGNPDGSFTSATDGSVKAALRFKDRDTGAMSNDGLGTYQFALGSNVNLEFSASSGNVTLGNYSYLLRLDIDPTASVNYLPFTFFPALTFADNSYGTASTLNGMGAEGPFFLFASESTVFQNSEKLSSFLIGSGTPGIYDAQLAIFSNGPNPALLAQSEARVIFGAQPIPEPATALFGLALIGAVATRRQRR